MAAALRLQKLARLFPLRRPLVNELCRYSSSSHDNPANPFKVDRPKGETWASWGFDDTDYLKDRYAAHCVFFTFITLFGFGWGVYFTYYPDFQEQDWANREAFLRIREREALGLPLVDPNYLPPEKVVLPSEEELGDFEIII